MEKCMSGILIQHMIPKTSSGQCSSTIYSIPENIRQRVWFLQIFKVNMEKTFFSNWIFSPMNQEFQKSFISILWIRQTEQTATGLIWELKVQDILMNSSGTACL